MDHRLVVTGRGADLYCVASQGGSSGRNPQGDRPYAAAPYIERADELADRERYQTVYARRDGGAVTAPTGLHLPGTCWRRLRPGHQAGDGDPASGAGTFQPVREDDIESHVMHRGVCRGRRRAVRGDANNSRVAGR
ncbi:MAG: S-adenosylmethionine:tRNA ribosyltransferase-isomerase [Halioglobus sp.]